MITTPHGSHRRRGEPLGGAGATAHRCHPQDPHGGGVVSVAVVEVPSARWDLNIAQNGNHVSPKSLVVVVEFDISSANFPS